MKKIKKIVISSLIMQIRAYVQLYTSLLTKKLNGTIELKFGLCHKRTEIPFYVYALCCVITPMYMYMLRPFPTG